MKELSIEDKELLLKDLCTRVPYHPKGHVVNACNGAQCDEWLTCATFSMFTNVINNCRLYLRPMSSMTKEERNELFHYDNSVQRTDFFYSHHIDCRFMIEKGLALEAPTEMYK